LTFCPFYGKIYVYESLIKGGITMGLVGNLKGFFSSSKNSQPAQLQINDEYEKEQLAEKIVDLVNKIKRINSFDSSIWNLSNTSSYELKRKSLNELKSLKSSLESRLSELNKQSNISNSKRENLEASKWTGQKPKDMSNLDFDRFQRDDR
jgi:hypothetical protein